MTEATGAGPEPAPPGDPARQPQRTTTSTYVIAGLILLAVIGGPTAYGLLKGGGDSQGLKSVRYVSAEADPAGRLLRSSVEAEYVVKTGASDEYCEVLFFDRTGNQLTAPNQTRSGEAGTRRTAGGRTKVQETDTYRYRETITVWGVPATARLKC